MSRATSRYVQRISTLLLLLTICIAGLSVTVDAKEGEINLGSNALSLKRPKQHTKWRHSSSAFRILLTNNYRNATPYFEVGFGDAPQILKMGLSMEASEPIWVPLKGKCGSTCDGKGTYDPDQSESSSTNKTTYEIVGGIGGVPITGYIYEDTLSVGEVEIFNQPFVAAYDWSVEEVLPQATYDGVIAIVAGDSYDKYFSSPWPQLLEDKNSSVIGLYMPPDKDGYLTLGYYNESLVKGEMVTVDSSVYADGLFTLPITQVKLGGQEIEGPVVAARLDISAPYSIVPQDVMAKIVELTNATHEAYFGTLYSVVCKPDKLPVLEITIEVTGSDSNSSEIHTLEIGPEYYIQQFGSYCTLSLLGGGVSTWILGGAILSKFYTVFDIKERILSIGELDADPPFLCGDPVWCLGDYSHASYNASYRCTVYKELGLSGTGIHVTVYRPGLLPFSIFSLLLGFTMAYIVAKYFWAGGRIDRVMYFVCFFCFGCMNTSGTILHCFTDEMTNPFTPGYPQCTFGFADDLFTSFTDLSYATCGIVDLVLLVFSFFKLGQGKSKDQSTSKGLLYVLALVLISIPYIIVFQKWYESYVLTSQGDVEAFLDTQDILYTWFNQHLPIVYIVAEIVYLIVTCGNLTNWLLLLTSAGIGLGGINFLSADPNSLCKKLGPYLQNEELWYLTSGTSFLFLGLFFIYAHGKSTSNKSTKSSNLKFSKGDRFSKEDDLKAPLLSA